jgi:uncharacterized RDD family membrane protein YckC
VLPAEVIAARTVAEERGIPVYPVDAHPIQLIADGSAIRILVNWVAFAAFLAVAPRSTAATATVIITSWMALSLAYRWDRRAWMALCLPVIGALVAWVSVMDSPLASEPFASASLAFVMVVVFLTLDGRNERMLAEIAEIADGAGHESGCLTTGKAHLSGLVSLADEYGAVVAARYVPRWCRRSNDVTRDPTSAEVTSDGGNLLVPRLAASLFDAVVVGVLFFAVSLFVSVFVAIVAVFASGIGVDASAGAELGLVAGALVGFCYYWLPEAAFGRSLGKALFRLRVLDADGRQCGVRAAFVRTLLRPLDLVVGLFVVLHSRQDRRLGDLVAGTAVVKRSKSSDSGSTDRRVDAA